MTRVVAIGAVLAAIVAAVVLLVTRTGDQPYEVRAIFDNAGFVIPGEDVKVAGVKVGTIRSLDVTRDFKAAVVLRIDDPGYQDFRRDATCQIRPQSLIGERFVECAPTQPHPVGQQPPPPLTRIRSGPGKGQYLLPVTHTTKSVDLDLINDIMREPERQRLSLILNELGTGLAGRGKDLNDVIRRADPALKQTDEVLKILASQNTVLEELARNADTVLGPLARERAHVAGAIRNSSAVAEATAERRGDLEADIRRLPEFLRQLKPTMRRLGSLADQMTPVLSDAHAVAPQINTLIEQLGPFSTAAIPAFDTLGTAARKGIPAVEEARPVIADLRRLASAVRPVGATAAAVLGSLQKTKGIERVMDYVFYQVAAINGYDSIGHYLRAGLIVNQCAVYAVTPTGGCSANFSSGGSASSATASTAASGDPVLARTARALATALGQEVAKVERHHTSRRRHHARRDATKRHDHVRKRAKARKRPERGSTPGASATATPTPSATPAPAAQPAPATTATPTATPTAQPQSPGAVDDLLNYLFGKDGG